MPPGERKRPARRLGVAACVALAGLAAVSAGGGGSGGRFRTPAADQVPSFPRDHGSHDDARVEWWYVTGHLDSASGAAGVPAHLLPTGLLDEAKGARASRFAARDVFLAHFARTDAASGTFRYAERIHRTGPGAAFAREDRLHVANEDWTLEGIGGHLLLRARDGTPRRATSCRSSSRRKAARPPRRERHFAKGPEPEAVSRYVSFTRLARRDGGPRTDERGRDRDGVDGPRMGPGSIGSEAAGWTGSRCRFWTGGLMLYRLRAGDGKASRFSSGTLVERDGRAARSAGGFRDRGAGDVEEPAERRTYPVRWRLRVPAAALLLDVVPSSPTRSSSPRSRRASPTGKEPVTSSTPGDGGREARGTPTKARGRGRAYVELTDTPAKGRSCLPVSLAAARAVNGG